jgi:hypothetical protein
MNTRYSINKHNITYTLDWKYLTYLIDKNDFENYNDIKNIKLDKTSIYSLTPHHLSYQIIDIFKEYLDDLKLYIITDACACIGGDSINFIKNFKFVNSIELDRTRYNFLYHNLNLYNYRNYKTYNDDCLNIIKNKRQDIIYFDLPWDGRDYKKKISMDLKLNNIDSSFICNNVIKYCKMICFKIPNNFDLEKFKKKIKIKNIKIHDLKKFKILIMFNKID